MDETGQQYYEDLWKKVTKILPFPDKERLDPESYKATGELNRAIIDLAKKKTKQTPTEILHFPSQLTQKTFYSLSSALRNSFFSDLEHFKRVFRYIHLDGKREKKKIKTLYSVDFSEIYLFLHPSNVRRQDFDEVGPVHYIFTNKRKEDTYFLSPPAAWEAVRVWQRLAQNADNYDDYEHLLKKYKLERFFNTINKSQKTDSGAQVYQNLCDQYRKIGNLYTILSIGADKNVGAQLSYAINRLKHLVERKIVLPMEEVVTNFSQIKPDQGAFKLAERYLSSIRPFSKESNMVDSLNLSIVKSLTKKYYSKSEYYVHLTHSKAPQGASRFTMWEQDPEGCESLSREPLYLVIKNLIREKMTLDRAIKFAKNGSIIMEKLVDSPSIPDYRLMRSLLEGDPLDIVNSWSDTNQSASYLETYWNEYYPIIKKSTVGLLEKKSMRYDTQRMKTMQNLQFVLQDRKQYIESIENARTIISGYMSYTAGLLQDYFDNDKYKHFLTKEMKNTIRKWQ